MCGAGSEGDCLLANISKGAGQYEDKQLSLQSSLRDISCYTKTKSLWTKYENSLANTIRFNLMSLLWQTWCVWALWTNKPRTIFTTVSTPCHFYNFLVSLKFAHRIYRGWKSLAVVRRRQILRLIYKVYVVPTYNLIVQDHYKAYSWFPKVTSLSFTLTWNFFQVRI